MRAFHDLVAFVDESEDGVRRSLVGVGVGERRLRATRELANLVPAAPDPDADDGAACLAQGFECAVHVLARARPGAVGADAAQLVDLGSGEENRGGLVQGSRGVAIRAGRLRRGWATRRGWPAHAIAATRG